MDEQGFPIPSEAVEQGLPRTSTSAEQRLADNIEVVEQRLPHAHTSAERGLPIATELVEQKLPHTYEAVDDELPPQIDENERTVDLNVNLKLGENRAPTSRGGSFTLQRQRRASLEQWLETQAKV